MIIFFPFFFLKPGYKITHLHSNTIFKSHLNEVNVGAGATPWNFVIFMIPSFTLLVTYMIMFLVVWIRTIGLYYRAECRVLS